MKFILFDKSIITINDESDKKIVEKITNLTDTKSYKRIGSGKMTFILDKEIPSQFYDCLYDSIDILKKVNKEKFPNYNYDKINDCGLCVDYYANGKKMREYYQINNLKQGPYKEYYVDGTIKIYCDYIDGKIEGLYLEYDQDGFLKKELQNKNGLLYGICKYYEKNQYQGYTEISDEITYIEGYKNGDFTRIIKKNDNNTIEKGNFLNNCKIESITTHNNNIIINKRYAHPNKDNVYIVEDYYDDNIIKRKYCITYNNNNVYENLVGIDSKYYENGIIESIQNYDDKTAITFYKNGNIKSEKQNNNEHYLIKCYYENGKLMSLENDFNVKSSNENLKQKTNIYILEKYNTHGVLITYTKKINHNTIFHYDCNNSFYDKVQIKIFSDLLTKSLS